MHSFFQFGVACLAVLLDTTDKLATFLPSVAVRQSWELGTFFGAQLLTFFFVCKYVLYLVILHANGCTSSNVGMPAAQLCCALLCDFLLRCIKIAGSGFFL